MNSTVKASGCFSKSRDLRASVPSFSLPCPPPSTFLLSTHFSCGLNFVHVVRECLLRRPLWIKNSDLMPTHACVPISHTWNWKVHSHKKGIAVLVGNFWISLDIIEALWKILKLSGEKCHAYKLKEVGRYKISHLPFHWISKKKNLALGKKIAAKKCLGRTLERLLVNSDIRCTYIFAKKHISNWYISNRVWLFNISTPCVWPLIP